MARPGKLRIIAGQWRGRKLDVLDSPGLRPTPDRVRETLFNWIQFDIHQSACLDLFSGTGALGFEALSRGASTCVFVDSSVELVEQLKSVADVLNSEHHVIHLSDALSWLQQCSQKFDIIFLDPPFQQGLVADCLAVINDRCLLNPDGIVYVEAEKAATLIDGWEIIKNKTAGQVQSMLIRQMK